MLMRLAILSFAPLFLLPSPAAADWPMHRGDAARSGYTAETLPGSLSAAWKYEPAHAPAPAWPRDDRMLFDRAFHVVAAGGTVFFGSSADGTVTALDAATGVPRWSFHTGGPVRVAPAVWKDRVFVASDDGFLYCLAAADGALVRKWRGGPTDEKVLGNSRIISRWPGRGGPVIADGVLYWAAGIWQAEGVSLQAIHLETGEVLWTNEDSARLYMPQPHGGANAASGVTAQGHLVVDGEHLFVPTGRAVPAVFRRSDGTFRYYHLQANGRVGGTPTMSAGRFFYNGGVAFESETGEARTKLGAGAVAAFPGGIYHANGKQLRALTPVEKQTTDRKGMPTTVLDHKTEWSLSDVPGGDALVVAGERVVSAGGTRVALIDAGERKVLWQAEVDGTAYGLAAADGRLYVSTDRGTIYCFSGEKTKSPRVVRSGSAAEGEPQADPAVQRAAAEIVERSDITEGYCVDLGCGDGSLALELARRTELYIHAIDSDPENVAAARRRLEAAGLYGARVTVHLGDPANTGSPKYFANLVVSGRSLSEGADAISGQEALRLQRPWGGVACFGPAGDMTVSTRGPLENAGQWTHQYADAANTGCSIDTVKGPLSVLWFRDIDLDLPQRHGRGPAPLFHEGRLFHEGMDELIAVDAYNGRPLWRFEMKGVLHAYDADHIVGASQTGSNFCAMGDSLYARQGGVCYRLSAATGEVLGTFETPKHQEGKPAVWGYIAAEDGMLFGSAVDEEHIVRHAWRPADREMQQLFIESKFLFAMDAQTGEVKWRYDAENSIRHNAIAIGDGRVFLIDRPPAVQDRLDRAAARRGQETPEPQGEHPTGKLVALDAATGGTVWTSADDIFGTMLAFSEKFDMLLLSYQSTRFKLPSEVGGRLAVFRASEGYRVWDRQAKYITRPLINDRTIYAQGGAWDLLEGEPVAFDFKRSYGCGQLAASKNLLLFRSATLGYVDLGGEAETEDFGGIRPGCWINAIPAGGMVLVPDASAGCSCSYQNRAWVALQGSGS
jgi:outer membrane protein assembly factor BamB